MKRGGSRRKHSLSGRRRKHGGTGTGAPPAAPPAVSVPNLPATAPPAAAAGMSLDTIKNDLMKAVNSTGLTVPPKGGSRRHKKRGGQWAQILSTAAVPGTLLYLQNKYSKKRGFGKMMPKFGGKRRTRRRR